jgi:hypothetical protein
MPDTQFIVFDTRQAVAALHELSAGACRVIDRSCLGAFAS